MCRTLLIDPDDVELLLGQRVGTPLRKVYHYEPTWGVLGEPWRSQISQLMLGAVPSDAAQPTAN
ncbi:hypothetical protein [Flexivirga alba]|uniref:Uncharacterized protein n=1 Tax=Flexivirga alba TaxID=702742 RepID=A0ABW2AK96_9MICO